MGKYNIFIEDNLGQTYWPSFTVQGDFPPKIGDNIWVTSFHKDSKWGRKCLKVINIEHSVSTLCADPSNFKLDSEGNDVYPEAKYNVICQIDHMKTHHKNWSN